MARAKNQLLQDKFKKLEQDYQKAIEDGALAKEDAHAASERGYRELRAQLSAKGKEIQ